MARASSAVTMCGRLPKLHVSDTSFVKVRSFLHVQVFPLENQHQTQRYCTFIARIVDVTELESRSDTQLNPD